MWYRWYDKLNDEYDDKNNDDQQLQYNNIDHEGNRTLSRNTSVFKTQVFNADWRGYSSIQNTE